MLSLSRWISKTRTHKSTPPFSFHSHRSRQWSRCVNFCTCHHGHRLQFCPASCPSHATAPPTFPPSRLQTPPLGSTKTQRTIKVCLLCGCCFLLFGAQLTCLRVCESGCLDRWRLSRCAVCTHSHLFTRLCSTALLSAGPQTTLFINTYNGPQDPTAARAFNNFVVSFYSHSPDPVSSSSLSCCRPLLTHPPLLSTDFPSPKCNHSLFRAPCCCAIMLGAKFSIQHCPGGCDPCLISPPPAGIPFNSDSTRFN